MAIIHTQCPRIESPCAQLPAFAPGQKSAFCDLCQKRVHNLSAMSARERAALLAGGGPLCVRYARLIPAAALLLAIFRNDMQTILERYVSAQRQHVVAAFEGWWDKYRVRLIDIEQHRDASASSLHRHLQALGYGN